MIYFKSLQTTTTTKPYPTKWGQLHGSKYVIVLYHKSSLDPYFKSLYIQNL